MPFSDFTRPGWGGANNDVDLHLEQHLGLVDSNFAYTSKFANMMDIRTLRGTNQLRLDRLGKATVSGRKAGEALNTTKIKQEKWNLVVDTTIYIRNRFDKFDDWTSNLDTRKDFGAQHGKELAREFDRACLIAAIKCADFQPPVGLEGAFHPGILVPVGITSTAADGEANANAIEIAHRKSIEQLINRDLGDSVYSEGVTFMRPDIFSVLMQSKKLMNVEYQAAGNDYARARIGMLNGVKVIETPRLPTGAITNSPLGEQFNVSADEAKRGIVTIIPSMSLVAAQVHALDAKYWEDEENFGWVLDTYQSYNIGARRPDSVAVVEVTQS